MRKTAKTTACILGLAGALVGAAALRPERAPAAALAATPAAARPRVQIALLLDTSSSMDGLIDQARSQLWRIVNELATAKKRGQAATVELALYEYGKSTVPAADGFVRRVVPFTTDLDQVSEALFALTTNGGEEYCGRAIAEATRGLEWSGGKDDLRLLFIAGNEPFDQGPLDWHGAIQGAMARGIDVHVVHAGARTERGWREAAAFAGADLLSIDHNEAVVTVRAPQDDEIARLGVELNGTYLPYGAAGAAAAARQAAQDSNAAVVQQGATVQRALSKASNAYTNESWDLVDGVARGNVDLVRLDEAALPAALRGLSPDERRARIAAAATRRQELQARIQKLDAERRAFVTAAKKNLPADTLDVAMTQAIRAQAEKRGFRLE
jgi:hypothetical protein